MYLYFTFFYLFKQKEKCRFSYIFMLKKLHFYYLINIIWCVNSYHIIHSLPFSDLVKSSVLLYLISGHFFKKQKIDILPAYFFIFLISYSRLFILILKKSIPSYIILLSKKLTKEECFYEILLQSRKNCK